MRSMRSMHVQRSHLQQHWQKLYTLAAVRGQAPISGIVLGGLGALPLKAVEHRLERCQLVGEEGGGDVWNGRLEQLRDADVDCEVP